MDTIRHVSLSHPVFARPDLGRLVSIDRLWAMITLLAPLWFAFMTPVPQVDFWWHLRVGQAIAQSGQIPTSDIYSFTAQGLPYGYGNIWLADWIMYRVYALGGVALLILLTGLLLSAAYTLTWLLARQAGSSSRLASVSVLVALLLAVRFSVVRPQIFSIFLFALFLWILQTTRHARRPYALLGLPPLLALWTNLHGAFPMALLLMVLTAADGFVARRRQHDDAPARAWMWTLLAVLLLSLPATALNPSGFGVYSTVRGVLQDPSSQQLLVEWQAQDIKVPLDMPFFAVTALTLLVLIYSRRRPRPGDVLLLAAFCAVGLSARRYGIWLSLIVPPIFARYAAQWSGRAAPAAPRPPRRRRRLNGVLAGLVLALTVMLSPWIRPQIFSGRFAYPLVTPGTPLAAAEYMAQQGVEGNVFAPQVFGDYLLWRLAPQVRVYVDGRVHLYPPDVWRDYRLVLSGLDWEARLEQRGVTWMLLDKTDPQEAALREQAAVSAHWTVRYQDEFALLLQATPVAADPS